ncbi:hypothetical protein [Virgibacillus doumboii]|uniref:hypothetical protein n=1 Tax=Virgibacillus doumboii TaxID=2697503 RepID=UPI0013E021A8|nr:hypothetical protein [Virgibacillus doumboii]
MRDTIYKKDIKNSGKQRCKQLERNQQFYKNKSHKNRKSPNAPSESASENYQREKKLRKRAQKDLHTVRNTLEQNKKTIKKQKQELQEYRKEVFRLKHDCWELTQSLKQVNTLEKEIKQQEHTIQLEREERLKAEDTVRQLEAERKKRRKNNNKMTAHTNQVKQLKQSNASLKRQLENYDLLSHQKYSNLEQEVKDLRKEVLVHRNREKEIYKNPMYLFPYLKQHITSDYLPDLLNLIEDSITTSNLPHFYRGPHNLFYLLMRRVNLLAYQTKKRTRPYHLQNTHNTNKINRLGYLIYVNDSWKFVDLSESDRQQVYPVIENLSDSELSINTPARAIFRQEGVNILHLFSLRPPRTPQAKQKHTRTKSPKKQYNFFGKFNILVLGSRFMNDYKYRLEKHGFIVELHNPYEESYELLKGKINRAEIILVCERHVPHSIWDYIDKTQPYVSVLKQDSKDLISTHAYLTLQRCELV